MASEQDILILSEISILLARLYELTREIKELKKLRDLVISNQ
jgi:hypothetical protein